MRYDAVILFFSFSTYFASLEVLFNPCFILLVPYLIRGWQMKRGKNGPFLYNAKEVQNPLSAPNLTLILRLKTFFIVEIM